MDRRSFEPKSAQRKLDQFKHSLIQLRPTDQVCRIVTEFVSEVLAAPSGIHTWKEEEGAFVDLDGSTRLMIYDPFLMYLADQDRIVRRAEFDDSPADTMAREARRFFDQTGTSIAIPLVVNQSLVGVVLARTIAGADFSRETFVVIEEIRSLASMALSNSILYQRLEGILSHLEEKVQERTRELENAQSQLVQSEKMAMLGVMVAGIAHEINTPAGVINGGVDNIEKNLTFILGHLQRTGEEFQGDIQEKFFRAMNRVGLHMVARRAEVKDAFKRKKTLTTLLEGENLACARDLAVFLVESGIYDPPAAGDTDEHHKTFFESALMQDIRAVFRALSGASAELALKFLVEAGSCARNLQNLRGSIRSIVRIIRALKSYSHLDQGKMSPVNIHEGLDNTLIILGSVMKNQVTVEREYAELPDVECNPDEMNQVWTNLITNAYQAMKKTEKAGLWVRTYKADDLHVGVSIRDNGPGIAAEIIHRIWDPFFTTKDQGEGSGLGLGIVKGIVEKHRGTIEVDSEVGRGTEFRVLLPVRQPEKDATSDHSPANSPGIFKFR